MILINLLPPEMRKRKVQIQFNPLMAGLAACILLNVLMIGGFFWLKHRKKYADELLVTRQAELAVATQKADAVRAMEAEIAAYRTRRDYILGLLNRKVFWAKTLDDFSNFLTQPFESYQVCTQSLTVTERAVAKGRQGGADEVTYGFVWRYKILGLESQKSGTYINDFFAKMQQSQFWGEYGFQGKPEDRYWGDRPRFNDDIGRVVIEGDLDWQRLKIAEPVIAGRKRGN